jgi:hypothetical protein
VGDGAAGMLEKKLWFAVCLPFIWEMELKIWTIFFFNEYKKKYF